jgi:hypothetical protein
MIFYYYKCIIILYMGGAFKTGVLKQLHRYGCLAGAACPSNPDGLKQPYFIIL